jgi:hypothetical protein
VIAASAASTSAGRCAAARAAAGHSDTGDGRLAGLKPRKPRPATVARVGSPLADVLSQPMRKDQDDPPRNVWLVLFGIALIVLAAAAMRPKEVVTIRYKSCVPDVRTRQPESDEVRLLASSLRSPCVGSSTTQGVRRQ